MEAVSSHLWESSNYFVTLPCICLGLFVCLFGDPNFPLVFVFLFSVNQYALRNHLVPAGTSFGTSEQRFLPSWDLQSFGLCIWRLPSHVW